jgi:hypothetical protein
MTQAEVRCRPGPLQRLETEFVLDNRTGDCRGERPLRRLNPAVEKQGCRGNNEQQAF